MLPGKVQAFYKEFPQDRKATMASGNLREFCVEHTDMSPGWLLARGLHAVRPSAWQALAPYEV